MERKFGALISPTDYRDYKTDILAGVVADTALPEKYLLPQKITIKDQGLVNSCVAHSLSSAIEAKEDKIVYSTGWIYGYRPVGYYQGEGMYMREALKTANQLGAVKNDDFNVNVEMQEAKSKVDEKLFMLEAFAEDTKLKSYARLYSNNEIKAWLMKRDTPVPACILVSDLKLDKNNIIQIPEKTNGGHAILIIGWNETGFIIQNSWGESWGDHGTAILPYEYTIQEAWGIEMEDSIKEESNTYKPAFYFLRRLLQWLVEIIKEVLQNGNKKGNS